MTAADVPFLTLGSLFDRQPLKYGTRGDTYLWAALRERFSTLPLPKASSDVERAIRDAFRELVGVPLEAGAEIVHVDAFDGGSGTHAGYVSPDWWATRLVPILLDRHDAVIRQG